MSYFDDIRKLIVARLVAKGVSEGRINESKVIPHDEDDLPAVNVYTLSGSGESKAGNANHFDAELTVSIDAFDRADTDAALADHLTALIAACLDAVMTDHQLASRFKITRYTFDTDLSIEGRERMAGAQIKLTGKYIKEYDFTFENDLESIVMTVKHKGHTVAEIDVDLTDGEGA
jgi:hypothetical protein